MPKWPINGSLGSIEVKSSKSFFVWHWFRNAQVVISISTWCKPTKHQFGHKFEAAAKWSKPKFEPWTRRTRVGCYGLSGDFTASSLALIRSILARQHDHPMLSVPAGIKRNGMHWKVRIWNLLTGMFTATAVLVDHCCPVAVHCHAHLDKPVLCANLAQVTGNRIHHPKTLGLFSQVLGAISQQVPAADTEIASCSNKLCQLGFIKVFHL